MQILRTCVRVFTVAYLTQYYAAHVSVRILRTCTCLRAQCTLRRINDSILRTLIYAHDRMLFGHDFHDSTGVTVSFSLKYMLCIARIDGTITRCNKALIIE